jgi:hypothetical protein
VALSVGYFVETPNFQRLFISGGTSSHRQPARLAHEVTPDYWLTDEVSRAA